MRGGTEFHFVTDGIEAARSRALEAAGGRDVRLGGVVATVRQFAAAGLVDELHLAISAVLLGSGDAMFAGMDWHALGYECERQVAGEGALHVFLRRRAASQTTP